MNKRIEILFSLCPKCDTIADVGADHGLLTEKLALCGNYKKIIASEITQSNLDKAYNHLKDKGLQNKVDFVLSDGFEHFGCKFSPECAIIAGMGGQEIVKILHNSKMPYLNTLILQPMKDEVIVREYLQNEYIFERDFKIKIGKHYYTFMKLRRGKGECLSQSELIVGKTAYNDAPTDLKNYLDENLKNEVLYLKGAKNSEQIHNLNNKIEQIKQIKELYYGKNA